MITKSPTIAGVEIKPLVTHTDERGFFREIIRETDEFFGHFGQWSHSLMFPGTAKAWHHHKQQTDWWYCIGTLKVALYDLRQDSPSSGTLMEFLMGERHGSVCVKIPPGVAHGCRALELTHLLYVTSSVYDPSDEGRLDHNDPSIGYDWEAFPSIK
ncbi:MAG TPA: dTDP-4-dehydrorhamnose 3,5-epimerase family protein [Candidatus Dormibacteraeota bacterium]|jgi:dTDP-4-dehydrorhamnose 3,5-epimerase|nr:dTDP-4-dehydrorhamnose 3,5-epimerase family protein [Candidatus Dormibacteraeota bacterium]